MLCRWEKGTMDEEEDALPVDWIPYPDAGIQAPCCYPVAIEGYGVDLAEVAL